MPTLKSRVTCYTLKKKHIFWKPVAFRFCWIISKLSLTNKCESKPSKCLQSFISWLVNSSLYSWESFSLTTWPQKHSTSAYFLAIILLQPSPIHFRSKCGATPVLSLLGASREKEIIRPFINENNIVMYLDMVSTVPDPASRSIANSFKGFFIPLVFRFVGMGICISWFQ